MTKHNTFLRTMGKLSSYGALKISQLENAYLSKVDNYVGQNS